MALYRNLKQVPIPKDAKVSPKSKRVYVGSNPSGIRRKREIGEETEPGMMVPNDNFRIEYPDLWKHHYPQSPIPLPMISVGNYAVSLSIGLSSGLYHDLQECFGPWHGNAIMDFARYMIREQSSVAMTYEQAMENQLFFLGKGENDSWFSNLFSKHITATQIHDFRDAWLNRCVANGMQDVWLCIDGSNSDSVMENSDLAELGHSKSLKDRPIISYIWAVDPASKLPVTWFVNNGGMPDCKAIDEIIKYLAASNLKIKGVILDRGFVSREVLKLLTDKGLDYIVMLTSTTTGFKTMLEKHGESLINEKAEYLLSSEYIFGVEDKVKVFANSKSEDCVALYFSAQRKYKQGKNFVEKLFEAHEQIANQIEKNSAKVTIPQGFKRYFKLIKDGERVIGFERDNAAVQSSLRQNGFHAIDSAEDRSALEIMELYRLRDYSEKQFSQLKTQLGGGTVRAHSDKGAQARFMVGFVASILRTYIMVNCQELKIKDTNRLIKSLDSVSLRRVPSGRYVACHNYRVDIEKLFDRLGIEFSHLEKLAEVANQQSEGKDRTQVRTLELYVKRGRGRPKGRKNNKTLEREAAEQKLDVVKVKRGPGRPKGRKNNKTLEREAAEQALGIVKVKRGPGRPKGRKNNATLEKEAAEQARGIVKVKRGPGRPKGRKNNATLEREAAKQSINMDVVKHGPGRPKGRKNNRTLEREAFKQSIGLVAVKRGRGRPKGRKNNKTLEREAAILAQTDIQ